MARSLLQRPPKLKANYVLFNLFSGKKLKHVRRMYRKYGIKRRVPLPISSIVSTTDCRNTHTFRSQKRTPPSVRWGAF